MITSYGPASDEESEDEVVSTKRKKNVVGKTKVQNTAKPAVGYAAGVFGCQMMGPELPSDPELLAGAQIPSTESDINSQTEDQMDSETVASSGSQLIYNNGEESLLNSDSVTCGTSTLLSNNVPDMGPPGDEMEVQEEMTVQKADSLKNDQDESGYSAPDSSEDKTMTDEAENPTKVNQADNTVAECESSVVNSATSWRVHRLKMEATESIDDLGNQGSGNTSPMPATTEEESNESGETDEGVILSRLRSQARVLKELGGEIPDEIRHLIDQSVSDSASPVVEDVIAQIERELPPDYVNNDAKPKEKDISTKKKVQSSSSSAEHSPKTTSFALIAGYGDGSDQEDDTPTNWQAKKTTKMFSGSGSSNSSATPLFPIADFEGQAGSSKEKDSKSVSSESTVTVSEIVVEDSSDNGVSENIPSSSKTLDLNSDILSGSNIESVAPVSTESCKQQDPSEFVSTGGNGTVLESNLPDSTTNNKAYKRKIRLEIGAIYPTTSMPKQSTSSEQSTTVTSAENKNHQPSTTAAAASSSSVNYSTWTHYNSDPTSCDRRGFGFQSSSTEEVSDYSTSTSSAKSSQKKGIINFVKAETINLPKTEEQVTKTAAEESQVLEEVGG